MTTLTLCRLIGATAAATLLLAGAALAQTPAPATKAPPPAATKAPPPKATPAPAAAKPAASACAKLAENVCKSTPDCAWIIPQKANAKTGKTPAAYCRKVAGVAKKAPAAAKPKAPAKAS